MPRPSGEDPQVKVAVDRIACSGHGVCAQLLPRQVVLDEWGYPALSEGQVAVVGAREAGHAVQLCPARALRVVTDPVRERRP